MIWIYAGGKKLRVLFREVIIINFSTRHVINELHTMGIGVDKMQLIKYFLLQFVFFLPLLKMLFKDNQTPLQTSFSTLQIPKKHIGDCY